MKTALLKDGDLSLFRREPVMATGTGKMAQDLRGALLEPLGNDRFHLGWGSSLHDFIARLATPQTASDVEAEVNRVIANYGAVQRDQVQADVNSDSTSRFTTDEVLARIQGVQVQLQNESVAVSIQLLAASGETVVLTEAVL